MYMLCRPIADEDPEMDIDDDIFIPNREIVPEDDDDDYTCISDDNED